MKRRFHAFAERISMQQNANRLIQYLKPGRILIHHDVNRYAK